MPSARPESFFGAAIAQPNIMRGARNSLFIPDSTVQENEADRKQSFCNIN